MRRDIRADAGRALLPVIVQQSRVGIAHHEGPSIGIGRKHHFDPGIDDRKRFVVGDAHPTPLGVRMAEDKPVALIRATGTAPIFDVDYMLRVEEYSPCLWPSTVELDMPRISANIRGAWDDRNNAQTYMKILRNKAGADVRASS